MEEVINLNNLRDITKLRGATLVNLESGKEYLVNEIEIAYDDNKVLFGLVAYDDIPKNSNGVMIFSRLDEIKSISITRQELVDKYKCIKIFEEQEANISDN